MKVDLLDVRYVTGTDVIDIWCPVCFRYKKGNILRDKNNCDVYCDTCGAHVAWMSISSPQHQER